MKKTGLSGYVYDFSVGCDATAEECHNIKYLDLLKNVFVCI